VRCYIALFVALFVALFIGAMTTIRCSSSSKEAEASVLETYPPRSA
jgi:hypothetical protein